MATPSSPTLKPNESKILVEAAANAGRLTWQTRLKESTRERLAGFFVEHALAELVDDALHLTPAGYRAVGMRPPRRPAGVGVGGASQSTQATMRDLLGRRA